MGAEKSGKFEWSAVLHDRPCAQDNSKVGHRHRDDSGPCRQGCLAPDVRLEGEWDRVGGNVGEEKVCEVGHGRTWGSWQSDILTAYLYAVHNIVPVWLKFCRKTSSPSNQSVA